MPKNIEFKIDRNKGRPCEQSSAIYYPITEEFYNLCQTAGDDLVIEATIISQYDEDEINYPSSRVVLKRDNGNPIIGLIPR